MSLRNGVRKVAILLALALSLALPGSAFAATTSGTTNESLTVNATISATFPAATSYVTGDFGGPNLYVTPLAYVTIVGSNNPSGVTITAQAAVWSGPGSITVPTNKRQTALSNDASTGSGSPLTAASVPQTGAFASTSTIVTLASSTGALAGRRIGVEWGVAQTEFTVAGTYNSSIAYVASTNP